jgi:hypothetical protein
LARCGIWQHRFGSDNEAVLEWFVLIVAELLDPAAMLLLLAATRTPS